MGRIQVVGPRRPQPPGDRPHDQQDDPGHDGQRLALVHVAAELDPDRPAGELDSGDEAAHRVGGPAQQHLGPPRQHVGGGGRGTGFSINGQRTASTNILLDGGDNNYLFSAGVGQEIPLDAVQEFSVISNNFSAQYGRASGGVVNLVTGTGAEVGDAIVESPDIGVISFTGSSATGRSISVRAGQRHAIIISDGENISTIEVEDVLYRHPAVLEAAVVARPDEKWGEAPCAFVELKPGAKVSEDEMLEFCRAHLARFKVPRAVVFGELPKTSTGKIQKYVLREQEWDGRNKRVN